MGIRVPNKRDRNSMYKAAVMKKQKGLICDKRLSYGWGQITQGIMNQVKDFCLYPKKSKGFYAEVTSSHLNRYAVWITNGSGLD